ncbi:MAG: GvpL/GvpF family gas vesicle protein [Acidobacteria bacterium]|nr:GvpL/GvpF family gas vesicle protein [Acidobacteriota bacterium]
MFYLYCLSDEATARMLEAVAGVGGVAPRVIEFEGIAVVLSEWAEVSVPVTRENVLAHERVVGRILKETTPLPFRFGTLADEERIRSYVVSQKASLLSALERVRGAVEMSVKIIWDVSEERLGEVADEGQALEVGAGAGTRFLLEKRRELAGEERLRRRAENLSARLAETLREVVKDSFVQVNPAESLVINASHLVERKAVNAYRARIEGARREQPELRFLTSGPWPPYSFSNLFS